MKITVVLHGTSQGKEYQATIESSNTEEALEAVEKVTERFASEKATDDKHR